jgi:hypothetical protein
MINETLKRMPIALIMLATGVQFALVAQDTTNAMRAEASTVYLSLPSNPGSGSARVIFGDLAKASGRPWGMISTSTGCTNRVLNSIQFPEGTILAAALDAIVALDGAHYWTIQDGVINFLPKQGMPSVMDIRVSQLEWDTTDYIHVPVDRLLTALGFHERLATEGVVGRPLSPSTLSKPPRVIDGVPERRVKIHRGKVENTTLLGALNAIVASYGGDAFWFYEEEKCGSQRTYQLIVREY